MVQQSGLSGYLCKRVYIYLSDTPSKKNFQNSSQNHLSKENHGVIIPGCGLE
jgi:hypothetical protein